MKPILLSLVISLCWLFPCSLNFERFGKAKSKHHHWQKEHPVHHFMGLDDGGGLEFHKCRVLNLKYATGH